MTRRFVALVAAAMALAAGPVHAAPLGQCAAAPGVNDKCESWNKSFSAASSGAVGMVVRGDHVFALGAGARPDNGQPSMVLTAYTTKGVALWTTRAPTKLTTTAMAIAASRDGKRVFATGYMTYRPSLNVLPFDVFYTMAVDGRSGSPLWVKAYIGGGMNTNRPFGITVSPAGDSVYVTGGIQRPCSVCQVAPIDLATVAYAASTGTPKWVARYPGAAGGSNVGLAVVVSPNGRHVYVTGSSERPTLQATQMFDWATAAYDARSGNQEWVRRYTSSGQFDTPAGVVVAPDGGTVYVAGTAQDLVAGGGQLSRITAVAYAARGGAPRWTATYRSVAGTASSMLGQSAAALTATGDKLVLTGQAQQQDAAAPDSAAVANTAVATVAFATKTGKVAWAALFAPGHEPGAGYAIGVSKSRVYVGAVLGAAGLVDWNATVAYDVAKGTQQWVARYDTREPDAIGPNHPVAVVPAANGSAVYELASQVPVTALAGQGSSTGVVLGYTG